MRIRRLAVLSMVLVPALVAWGKKPLTDVALVWKPTETLTSTGGVAPTRIEFTQLGDPADQPKLIAENREDKEPKPVTTKDDVGGFVTSQARRIFTESGWTTVDQGGDVVLSGEVRRFFVEETDTYKGSVVLHIVARSRSGRVLWDGVVSGAASTFGRSYSMENYSEVLSDSLLRAVSSLIDNADFHKALMQPGG